ncbi:MAG: hypothetical protein ACO3JG_11855 [Luteolibacter sp.]
MPDVPANTGDTVIRVVTDPRTGLSMQVRDRYDGRLGKQEVSFTLMYGFGSAPACSGDGAASGASMCGVGANGSGKAPGLSSF